jgi:hypothetical protein
MLISARLIERINALSSGKRADLLARLRSRAGDLQRS